MSETAVLASAARAAVRQPSRAIVALFAGTLFTSAFLMFLLEPMVARMVLPSLGGAPAVWNTCLVFFQTMLLGGYAYAHGSTAWLGVRRHLGAHTALVVLPLLALPFSLTQLTPPAGESPALWLLLVLLSTIGLPFFVLSTSAAVLQKWYSSTGERGADDPYFLYTASNLGSFVALLAYPILVEPTLRLQEQARLWTAGYALLVALTAACAAVVFLRMKADAADGQAVRASAFAQRLAPTVQGLAWGQRIRWTALAFAPSSLLLAVTSYMATDVASVPLLWIVPLSLYLLTFIVAFNQSAGPVRRVAARLAPMLTIVLTLVLIGQMTRPLWLVVPLHLLLFVALATACHGELADDRPSPAHLTEFYFWISLGGMLGGLFNALVAPLLFTGIAEYPIVLVLACALRARSWTLRRPRADWTKDALFVGGIAAIAVAGVLVNNHFGSRSRFLILAAAVPALVAFRQQRRPIRFAACIAVLLLSGELVHSPFGRAVYAGRTFFGVYRVRVEGEQHYRFMFHGTTLHGMQHMDPRRRHEPLSYFHQTGPIGQVFRAVPAALTGRDIAVVGLGVGSLASYAGPTQHFTFFEIDPAVETIARDASLFTYLPDCGSRCTVKIGDARLSLVKEPAHRFDLIVLDAFSSDAVPIHLLTREAMQVYLSRLAPGGAIALHISNMHLALAPVLARIARAEGLAVLAQREPATAGSVELGKFPSEWMVVARQREDLGRLLTDSRWIAPPPSSAPLWTDDFSNILSVLKTP
jgi:hypothetical protein